MSWTGWQIFVRRRIKAVGALNDNRRTRWRKWDVLGALVSKWEVCAGQERFRLALYGTVPYPVDAAPLVPVYSYHRTASQIRAPSSAHSREEAVRWCSLSQDLKPVHLLDNIWSNKGINIPITCESFCSFWVVVKIGQCISAWIRVTPRQRQHYTTKKLR